MTKSKRPVSKILMDKIMIKPVVGLFFTTVSSLFSFPSTKKKNAPEAFACAEAGTYQLGLRQETSKTVCINRLKIIKFFFIALSLGLNIEIARAASDCFWINSGTTEELVANLIPSRILEMKKVPIGQVMATFKLATKMDNKFIKCPISTNPRLNESYSIQGQLEEGFTNIYKTGLQGVGVRFSTSMNNIIPYNTNEGNGAVAVSAPPSGITVEVVRTNKNVASGEGRSDVKIKYSINGMNAAEINVNGTTNFKSKDYFAGCVGLENINVPMGKVAVSDIGKGEVKRFNLDVVCSGMAPGTQVPVKVYFEGRSTGTGYLGLEPGGAQGVEIHLWAEGGYLLPFEKTYALKMSWIKSEPRGEMYRLPVLAEYQKRGSQKVEVGKANATLNYILEYN